VRIAVRPRSALLAGLVRSVACGGEAVPPARERVLPFGGVSLLVNLHEDEFRTYHGPRSEIVRRTGGAVLAGPRAGPVVIDTEEQRCLVEVNFEPGGAWPFFGIPLAAARDELVELGELWGRDGAVLRERLLEASTVQEKLELAELALVAHAVRPLDADPAVGYAVAAFEHGLPVSAVTDRLGVLPKRLVGLFRDQLGLTPKRFSRIRRLQRLLGAIEPAEPIDWSRLALAHGYYDQSHLVNDFGELTGITPTAYRARSTDAHNHVPLAAG
jgi:AraC-like DNA-binding protein